MAHVTQTEHISDMIERGKYRNEAKTSETKDNS